MQDLIERRAALTALCEDCLQKYEGICPHPASRCVEFRTIKQLPAIEAEPVRHGRWDEIQCFSEHGIEMASYECTSCGNDIERQRGLVPPYCEFCGAKMYQTGGTISKERFAEIGGAENG